MERLKRNFQHRATLPNNEYVGQIFKIEMMKASNDYNYTIVDMGAHLFTDEVNEEVTIRMFNGNTYTYGMGYTRSSPATIDEITDWLNKYWYGENKGLKKIGATWYDERGNVSTYEGHV